MIGVFSSADGLSFDLRRDLTHGGHLETDPSLRTCVLISLLTEARANAEDLPAGQSLGGWWGDSYPDVPGYKLGGRVWVLARGRATPETLILIEQAARAALQWMIDDGIAESVQVTTTRVGLDRFTARVLIQRQGALAPEWIDVWGAS
jgi:phage gp46-like protein